MSHGERVKVVDDPDCVVLFAIDELFFGRCIDRLLLYLNKVFYEEELLLVHPLVSPFSHLHIIGRLQQKKRMLSENKGHLQTTITFICGFRACIKEDHF